MTKLNVLKMACAVFVLCAATAIVARAQTFADLVDFDGINGDEPMMSLVQGADGNFYGTTFAGGQYYTCRPGCGTVFKVSPGGITTLHNFCADPTCPDGDQPDAGLVLGIDGNFYGSTHGGWAENDATVFRISPNRTLTTLHIFGSDEGYGPEAALIQAINTNFYGTTNGGGDATCNPPFGCGTVFKMTPGGTLTSLHTFHGTDGANPYAGLTQGSDGNFYGTTSLGGTQNVGTVFRMTAGGALTTLYSFCIQASCTDGTYPNAGLIQARDGNFYGTTSSGGNGTCSGGGCGTVFKITAGGTLTTLHSFDSTDGANPFAGLIQATDGSFYGTTTSGGDSRSGTIFKITLGGELTTLHSFGGGDGFDCLGALVQSTNGILYGTTSLGGIYGHGNVFSLDMGLGPFVAFVHSSGKVGQTGGILGQGFAGATTVLLNGTPATFTVRSNTYLTATVPEGATSGYVTVTTPRGKLTSNVPFHVLP